MTCNFNTNYSSNPAFKSLHAVGGGQQLLERTLNKAEKLKLQKLIESQKKNPINVTIAELSEKRLCGWTVFKEESNGIYHRKDYSQGLLFDSPLKFIKKICKKADKLHEKYKGDIESLNSKEFELLLK